MSERGRGAPCERLSLRGASEHNLRNVNLDLPHNALIVFTGVSGSGKSSLAFDTLFAEGQRRYVESLSPYARQFLQQIPRPKVRRVDGLRPAIAIDQAARSRNPRSTVATITEIYDHLRVLFAAIGHPHCPRCGRPIGAQSREALVARVLALPRGTRVTILAPLERGRRGTHLDLLEDLRRKGFGRVRADGEVFSLLEPPELDRRRRHDVDLIVDRVSIEPAARARVAEALDVALEMSGGDALLAPEHGDEVLLSRRLSCPDCAISLPEATHASFSFNSPRGMCPECEGLGVSRVFDVDRLIAYPERSLPDGAIPLLPPLRRGRKRRYNRVARHYGFDLEAPWCDLKPEHQQILLHGVDPEFARECQRSWSKWARREGDPLDGIIGWLVRRYKRTRAAVLRRRFERYMRIGPCAACGGRRLKPESLAVLIGGASIADLVALTVEDASRWFADLQLSPVEAQIAEDALKEIRDRLSFLSSVGLGYLTLDRTAPTLAGGEAQRLRLASQVGAGLSECLYVLDEPSIGLHPRDQAHLLETLRALRDRDNTVVVVEHDEQTILAADWVVDFGPGPGLRGGRIVTEGTPAQVRRTRASITGRYLSGECRIPVPRQRRRPNDEWLVLRGARHNNLKALDVRFPLGTLICVSGVSGSGKSSLVADTLHPALARELHRAEGQPGDHDGLEGVEYLRRVVLIDQDPIGRTPRSNPATYVGLFDHIRALFAQLPESRARGYLPGRFSFNKPEGRCPACSGHGARHIESDFLADVWVTCEACGGSRFTRETLAITYKGATIADVLDMEVTQALEHFAHLPRICAILQVMADVGLGYIKLGQPATTLSGGEAQRVKLAEQLARPHTTRGMYILDEPTTGLHLDDVRQLIAVLQRFVDEGNTVVVVEHHPDVIKCADWVIDLGPEGGAAGGYLVAEGPPEQVAASGDGPTARVLCEVLAGRPVRAPVGRRRRPRPRPSGSFIEVHGAREHNLKDVSLRLPRNRISVCVGVSGSGKTSLALDTIYAEGQRRFVESLSTYARQFVSQMPKPKVDRVSGLSPAIALDQRGVPHNPRATVGTMTQVYDYLRVLFSRLATPYCPECGGEIGAQTVDHVVDRILAEHAGEPAVLLGPVKLSDAEDYADAFERLARHGWRRVRVDGETLTFPVTRGISRRRQHRVELVVDRLTVQPARRSRLAEAVEAATDVSGGEVVLLREGDGEEERFSLMHGCPSCGRAFEPLTPRHFSFNHPRGWCRTCFGLGVQRGVDPETTIADEYLTLREGAITLWGPLTDESPWTPLVATVACNHGFSLDSRIVDLTPAQRRVLLHGSDDVLSAPGCPAIPWRGVLTAEDVPGLLGATFRRRYSRSLGEVPCPACGGGRLRPAPAAARLAGRTIASLTRLPLPEAHAFFRDLRLSRVESQVGEEILAEVRSRLRFLVDVGLEYLTLDRPGPTLSGGEAQRVRLAGQLGSGLTGLTYVMDEPTIGIHPRDNDRMLHVIERLRDEGNTLLVVEHDLQTLRHADHLVEFGPGAGPAGGRVVASGSRDRLARSRRSLTGRYLAGDLAVPVPETRRLPADPAAQHDHAPGWLVLEGCRQHNLRDLTVRFPLQCLVCVTGPSGSGKSTLVQDVLYPALARRLGDADARPGRHRSLRGWKGLRGVRLLDQSPIGRSPRSNPATYVGVLSRIREFFARLPEARLRGFQPGFFSFNRRGGRCDECDGMGARLVQMHFLPDVWVTCEECGGRRFKPEVLDVRYRGRNIADVLEMSLGEAAQLFASFPRVAGLLRLLCEMGLDYLPLGQAAPTLSGGEAQRMKIARELLQGRRASLVYLLDEPTTGLHPADILKLLRMLNRLVDEGSTVIVIEHNLDVVKNADWVVDLGPGGGDEGGRLMAQGPPELVAQAKAAGSPTAPYLRQALAASPAVPRAELTLPGR